MLARPDDLISAQYRELLRQMRETTPTWGSFGYRHAEEVAAMAKQCGAKTILDYGSGTGSLARRLREITDCKIMEYDPCTHDTLPEKADLVVCVDVLEHVELDKLDAVLGHIFELTQSQLYLSVATRPSKAILPDGTNAHLIVQNAAWWEQKLVYFGPWRVCGNILKRGEHDITFRLAKRAMPLTLVCFYADLGRPYLPLIQTMTQSAKAVMPDCRLMLMTPTPSQELKDCFDQMIDVGIQTTAQTVCFDKARAVLTWQLHSTVPTVFVDPDMQFRHPLKMPGDADVGLLWCDTKIANPINGGMIFAHAGHKEFWQRYANIVGTLPKALHGWWGDQLALSIMIGLLHKAGDVVKAYDARVKLLAVEDICCAPERATESTWAIHYKGLRKGDEFKPYFGSSKARGGQAVA